MVLVAENTVSLPMLSRPRKQVSSDFAISALLSLIVTAVS